MNTLTQQILNNPSEAARKIMEDYKNGITVLGSQKKKPIVTKKPKKNKNHLLLVMLLCFLAYYYCFIMGKYNITGFAMLDNNKPLKNQQLAFYNIETQRTTICNTNSKAEFNVKLPAGNYKVYGKGKDVSEYFQKPQASIIKLNISQDSNYRITVKR